MANSFLKSLPSHKKKRKLRHRERRAGSQTEHHSQKSAEHHEPNRAEEPATQATNIRLEIEEVIEDEESDQSLLSESETCVPGTEFQYPIAKVKTKQPSQDEETIGMYSPLSGRAPVLDSKCAVDSVEKGERRDSRQGRASSEGGDNESHKHINLPPLNGRKPAVDGATVNQQGDRGGSYHSNRYSARNQVKDAAGWGNKESSLTCTLQRSDVTGEKQQSSRAVSENVESGRAIDGDIEHPAEEAAKNQQSIRASTVTNRHFEQSSRGNTNRLSTLNGSDATANTATKRNQEASQTPKNISRAAAIRVSKTEWCLTSTDISKCIDEIKAATKIADEDHFADVDLASFQTTLESFKDHVVSLSNPSSNKSIELKDTPQSEWAFAIFEGGIDVSHCNVCFICDMIDHIAGEIEDLDEDSTKLRELAECMELAFGVHHENEDSGVSVSVSKSDDGVTKLLFKRDTSTTMQSTTESSIHQSNNRLPSHLDAVSKIFEQYSNQTTQSLRSQLDSTQSTLAKTREGAMQLQKTALDLQNQLQLARLDSEEAESRQTELEAALNKQQSEFEKRLESSERVKEHYKRLLDQKEKELMEARAQIQRKAAVPDTVQSTAIGQPSPKRMAQYDSKHKSDVIKYGQRFDVGTSRATKRNRISVEPSKPSGNVKDAIHESPPILPPINSDGYRKQSYHEASIHRPNRRDSEDDRNPLGSLTVNSFHCQPTSDADRDDKGQQASIRHSRVSSRPNADGKQPNIGATVSKRQHYPFKKRQVQVENPCAKKPGQESNCSDQFDFKYQEVVRGKQARAALPAHECEACRKFNDAVYAQTGSDMPGREQMIKECSRHRARFAPELTPADFWDMNFIDER